jgi:hypothetical protein
MIKKLTVHTFRVSHRIDCFGFYLEKRKLRSILQRKLECMRYQKPWRAAERKWITYKVNDNI